MSKFYLSSVQDRCLRGTYTRTYTVPSVFIGVAFGGFFKTDQSLTSALFNGSDVVVDLCPFLYGITKLTLTYIISHWGIGIGIRAMLYDMKVVHVI